MWLPERTKMIRIGQIKIDIEKKNIEKELDREIKRLLKVDSYLSYKIVKLSIDARKKPKLYYVYTLDVEVENQDRVLKKSRCKTASVAKTVEYKFPTGQKGKYRPVIVGMGPAGLFCAYMLSKAGVKPLVYERGGDVDTRSEAVERFWREGVFNPITNVQFGEGGAGTFSDGKLNTLVNDKFGRNKEVLEILVRHGAPENILYDSKPHIGTDILKDVVKDMRHFITENGGEVKFLCSLTDIEPMEEGLVKAVFSNGEEVITDALVLAIGHSARDTFEMLHKRMVPMEAKSFAVGLRVLHPQELINDAQYGYENRDKGLPASSYKLTFQTKENRGVYSFCMCPGGYVVNASSEEGRLAINGMSYHSRDGKYANSAVIMTVSPEDCEKWLAQPETENLQFTDNPYEEKTGALKGMYFQRELEKRAYLQGAGKIPYETFGEFKAGEEESKHRLKNGNQKQATEPVDGFKGGAVKASVHKILPMELNNAFIQGMDYFDNLIKGFGSDEALVAGVESRTSSPIRIKRGLKGQSEFLGIYPCGEGAGYAGGIMSAAMDGMLIAEEIWKK